MSSYISKETKGDKVILSIKFDPPLNPRNIKENQKAIDKFNEEIAKMIERKDNADR